MSIALSLHHSHDQLLEPPDGSNESLQKLRRFVRGNTSAQRPPHVGEVELLLAHEAHGLWLKTEEELSQLGLPPPFWAFAWAGGQGLARHVLDDPACVRGRRVADFATGSGLVAIAAAKAGAAEVTAFDIDPFAGVACGLNAEMNAVVVAFAARDVIGQDIACDVLLAGDVFYDKPFADRLAPWFDTLARRGIDILVGDPGRAYLPKDRLTRLSVHEVPVTRALEDTEIKRTIVWRWTVKSP